MSFWLPSLRTGISRATRVAADGKAVFLLAAEWCSAVWAGHVLGCESADRHSGVPRLGCSCWRCSKRGRAHTSSVSCFRFMYSGMELLDHMVMLFKIVPGTFYIVFWGGWTNSHSCQQYTKVPFSPHPHQHLFYLFDDIGVLFSIFSLFSFFKTNFP